MEKKVYFAIFAIILAAIAIIDYLLLTSDVDLVSILIAVFSIGVFVSYGIYATRECLNDAD